MAGTEQQTATDSRSGAGVLLQDGRLGDSAIPRRQFGRLLEGQRGLVVLAQFVQSQPQIELSLGQIGIGFDGFPKMTFRHIPMALLGVADTFIVGHAAW